MWGVSFELFDSSLIGFTVLDAPVKNFLRRRGIAHSYSLPGSSTDISKVARSKISKNFTVLLPLLSEKRRSGYASLCTAKEFCRGAEAEPTCSPRIPQWNSRNRTIQDLKNISVISFPPPAFQEKRRSGYASSNCAGAKWNWTGAITCWIRAIANSAGKIASRIGVPSIPTSWRGVRNISSTSSWYWLTSHKHSIQLSILW